MSNFRIAVIGAGPTGIAAGRELLQQGFNDFTIFEASEAVGGTWHVQTYPGLACDVWAHSYTFSYAPNPEWSASFVEQPEIESYLQGCATKFGLTSHIRLNTNITRAEYQNEGHWLLYSEADEEFRVDVVINAMGNQHTALFPDIPGMDLFAGDSWHSTRWNHAVDLQGKRIAVVGSAASAVQIVPEIARQAGQLYVLQRTPNWIMPRGRKPYSAFTKSLFRTAPILTRMLRAAQGRLMNMVHKASLLGNKRMDMFEKQARNHLTSVVADEKLRDTLTPHTRFACKRPLVSDDFYPALLRDNVELIPTGAREVTANGLTTNEGRELEVDVIVYCTGYKILDFDRIAVVGNDGRKLAETMAQAPEAYKGIAVPGFPNYFFGVGPNALVLSVSYFLSAEANVKCIVKLLADLRAAGAKQLSVKKDLHTQYNEWLRSRFSLFSWGHKSCNSYYQTATGSVPFLFPDDFKTFKRQRLESGLHEYDVQH